MTIDIDEPGDDVLEFLRERHLATLTTLRTDGSPHVVPVGFGYDHNERLVRVITQPKSQKVANARRGGRAVVSQVDGARWLSLEGEVQVVTDPDGIALAVEAYTNRYQAPRERPERVALEIRVDRMLGRA